MMTNREKPLFSILLLSALLLPNWTSEPQARPIAPQTAERAPAGRTAPVLGTDYSFDSWPHPLIAGWQDKERGDEMERALKDAGVRSIRFLFGGIYSPLGPEATARVKAENKATNEYPWFPIEDYINFIASHDFTTVIGVNVEEGSTVARDVVQKFIDRGLQSKIVAIELSNEPWLNHRPWQPEEYASRAADVIEGLTPLGVRFALPLTVGNDNNTPTKLSDNQWNTRMLKALSGRIDLKNRADIYGVLHLYSRGVSSGTVEQFNKAVRPFAPRMRYLVTEFNIRLDLKGNPHLTNEYAIEFARKLADVMSAPEIEAMYVHSVPYHSILYWANGKRIATVKQHRDPRLTKADLTRGWHRTPAGKVYDLYSRLAWNGEVITFRGGDKQSYWAVKAPDGRLVVTILNDSGKATKKKAVIAGQEMTLTAPPRAIVCYDQNGQEIERLILEG
jgi:hypothetical protein